jgi:hypothetical protein
MMNVLKGFILAILGFLLFVFLAVFGLVFTLHSTVLNADFVALEFNKLDMASLAEEFVSEKLPGDYKFATKAVYEVVAEIEPWIEEQASIVIHSTYDYALRRSDSLKVVIPLEAVKVTVREKLRTALMQSLPPEYQSLPPATVEYYYNQFYQELTSQIPSTFEINENQLPQEVRDVFQQVRHYAVYYQITYWGLMGLIVVFMLLIFATNGNVRGTTRSLGIIFLCCGAIGFVLTWVIDKFAAPYLSFPDLPSALQSWIPQVFDDFLAPMQWFNVGLLIAGAILLVISLLYPKPADD